MTKTNKIKDYIVYDLTAEEVKQAIISYLYDEHTVVADNGSIHIHDLDGSATVTVVWADKEKAQS